MKFFKILAIDSATDACSVALLAENHITEIFQMAPQQHGNLLLPMIEKLLTQAKLSLASLNALAFSCGPGSFTGIRIAAGIIQGLALSADLPVVPISTLQTMAQGAFREKNATRVLVSLDARMHEIYWGVYQLNSNQIMQPVISDNLYHPTEIPIPSENNWLGIGNGWQIYGEILEKRCQDKVTNIDPNSYPHAQDMLAIALERYQQGSTVTAEEAAPLYLRDEGAWKKTSR